MKKILYLILIILFICLFLKSCLKKDLGYDVVDVADIRPLEVVSFENIPHFTKTIDGVDYLMTTAKIGKFGGEVVSSTIGEGPKTFNPFVSNDNTSSVMASLMFDGLLTTNAYTGEVEPRLAKEIEILPDKLTYIIKLRKGVMWSDGVEITADDVFYTYNTIIFGGFGNTSIRDSLYIEGKLPTIKKIDKYTVEFKTPKPFAPFLRNLTTPIAPKHIFKPATDKGKSYFGSFYTTVTKPKDFVVSGAFKLKEYVPAQRVVFEKNPNYYVINEDGKKLPYIDRYIILIVGDLNNETIKFEGGEIDVLNLQPSIVSTYKEKELSSDYKLYNLGASTNTLFLTFNLNTRKNDKGKFYVDPIKQVWFTDKNFRTAIDYAIDRVTLVSNILGGIGEPLYCAESPASIFLNEKIAKGHGKDLEYAKELLKSSGFYLKDGILYDKFNNKVEFELLTNAGNTQREATGVSIKEDLAALGITVNFKPIEFNTLVNRTSSSLDYEAVIIALTSNPYEPHSGYNVWNSWGTLHMFNQRTENDKKDDRFDFEVQLDEIYDKAPLILDFEKRKELYNKYQEIVYENRPFIYLYSPTNIVAVRKRLGNVYPTQLGGVLHNIEEIYLK